MAGTASTCCRTPWRLRDPWMFNGVTPQGKGVCRAHNSSRPSKKKIRQGSCEDDFKMWPHKFGRKDGGTEPHLSQQAIGTKIIPGEPLGLLASMTGRCAVLWSSCRTFADRVFPRPTDQPLGMELLCLCPVLLALLGNRGSREAVQPAAYSHSGLAWRPRGVQWPRVPMKICHNWVGYS